MNDQAYAFIENNEDFHWWFKGRLNIIRMLDVLEHISEVDKALREVRRVVKKI